MFYNLLAEMARNGLSLKNVAQGVNIKYDTLRNKMHGRSDFTREEMFLIKTTFFPSMSIDYLFEDRKEANNEQFNAY